MSWQDLINALALLLIIEGIFPFINPNGMKRTLLTISQFNDHHLRFGGLTSMLLGLLLLSLLK